MSYLRDWFVDRTCYDVWSERYCCVDMLGLKALELGCWGIHQEQKVVSCFGGKDNGERHTWTSDILKDFL